MTKVFVTVREGPVFLTIAGELGIDDDPETVFRKAEDVENLFDVRAQGGEIHIIIDGRKQKYPNGKALDELVEQVQEVLSGRKNESGDNKGRVRKPV